jgi:peptidoglycan/LPS O-acetylase OafA/YrhL
MSAEEGFAEPGGRDKDRISRRPVGQALAPIRLPYLDGLRALAATYVVGFHAVLGFTSKDLTGGWRLVRRAFAFGHEAVAVFIVLSGYCLMLPVVRNETKGLTVELGRFIRRRALRILPPYFAALAISLALLALVPVLRTRSGTTWDDSLPGLDLGAVGSHLLLVHNWSPAFSSQINGPLWSVASEWQIYFFFPLVLLPVWRRFNVLGAIGVAAVLGYGPLLFVPARASVAIPWYLLLFTFGMAAAWIGFSPLAWPNRLLNSLSWTWWSRAMWLSCAVLGLGAGRVWFAFKALSDAWVGLATATLLVALTARSSRTDRGLFLQLLESRPLLAIGHFSFSLYLMHLPVLALVFFALRPIGLSAPSLTLALVTLGGAASLAVAYAFYLAVERRFIVRR